MFEPFRYDLTVYLGHDRTLLFTMYNASGVAMDITDYAFFVTLFRTTQNGDTDNIAALDTGDDGGITILDQETNTGQLTVALDSAIFTDPETGVGPGTYFWKLYYTPPNTEDEIPLIVRSNLVVASA